MIRRCVGLLLLFGVALPLAAQNSTKKIRREPSDLAARAGSAVAWRADVATALAEAKERHKPVFWYVPSVARSPMDRKPEIDRYMKGGPFSWPTTIALLNEHFVPVEEIAGGDERSKSLGLVRNQFLEPGYVVLDADGRVVLQVDQLTTFHPGWFEAPLRRIAKQPAETFPCAAWPELWQAARSGPVGGPLPAFQLDTKSSAAKAEMYWLMGTQLFRAGSRQRAEAMWRQLVQELPDEPWAWKAALELEGHGPFVHAFEVYGELPDAVLAKDPVDGTRAVEGTFTEPELWQRSVAFLAATADDDGVYRDSIYDFGGTDGLPNVHAAVTCLVGEALLAATARIAAGELALPVPTAARVETLLAKLHANALAGEWLALSDRDEILWARAYALRFLLVWRARRGGGAAGGDDDGIRHAVAALLALQPDTGVWFHEYGNPFAIATALQALAAAKAAGIEVPQDNLDKGLRALVADRTAEGAFSYGQTREGREPRASVEAAAGRMPLCELALFLHGASDQTKLLAAAAAGERHHALLAEVRKYDDHASRLGYGGFFFWFDMLGRAEAIAALTDAERRHELAAAQRARVLALPEFDGCFVDSHELGRCYGTAMALLCLDVLARAAR